MAAILTAVQCPAVQVPSAAPTILSSYESSGVTVPGMKTFAQADTTTVPSGLNANLRAIEYLSRSGGGGIGIIDGLTLSAGSGLTLNVAAGRGLSSNPIELAAASTVVAVNNARSWVWMQQTGVLPEPTSSLSPPSTDCILLGSCLSSAGAITSVDTSGVMYLRSTGLWRQTADTGMPTDTPPAGIMFYTLTAGGLYLWDGAVYRLVGTPNISVNKDTIPAGEVDTVPTGTQVLEFGPTTVYGTLTVYGRFRTTY